MARSVAAASEAGFFARHWVGLIAAFAAVNAVAVGAILFEPGPARAQPVVPAADDDEDAATAIASPRVAVGAQTPEPAPTPSEKPVDLKLPGYLPPLKGMPQVAALPIGPDGQPMSPELGEGFAMIDQFRTTLDRLLGDFERAGRTTAAAEAFNRAFAAEAQQMSVRAMKLETAKLSDAEQGRLRAYAEKVLLPLISRMQTSILASMGDGESQEQPVAPEEIDGPSVDVPVELQEELLEQSHGNPVNEYNPDDPQSPDPLTRAILE